MTSVRLYDFQGKTSSWPEADRAWQFGDGVFRTALIVNGRVLDLQGQVLHLLRDARVLNLAPLPDPQELAGISANVAAGFQNARMKWVISAGDSYGGYARAGCARGRIAITSTDVTTSSAPDFVDAWVCQTRVIGGQPWSHIKHLNRLENVMARLEQPAEIFREALMSDTDGNLVSGLASNVFWVNSQGRLCTNPLERAGTHGRSRARILERMQQQGHEVLLVEEQTEQVLQRATEVFFTNSLWGCMPLRRCGQWSATSFAVARDINQWLRLC